MNLHKYPYTYILTSPFTICNLIGFYLTKYMKIKRNALVGADHHCQTKGGREREPHWGSVSMPITGGANNPSPRLLEPNNGWVLLDLIIVGLRVRGREKKKEDRERRKEGETQSCYHYHYQKYHSCQRRREEREFSHWGGV